MDDPGEDGHGRTIYLDGARVPEAAARLAVGDHGVLYGLGFFETFRTSRGCPHLWELHRRRLLEACVVAGIGVPAGFLVRDEAKLREILRDLLKERGMEDGVFRYTVSAGRPSGTGGGAGYTQPSEWLTVRPMPHAAPAGGVTLRILKIARDSGEWLPRPKSLNYANALLGGHELRRRGAAADDEGLFLAREGGWVVETPRRNLAWVVGGRFLFPDPALGAVAGTCLQWLCELGVEAHPCRATVAEVARAEAVVLLNSVRGVTPVRAIWDANDGELIGSWESQPHPLVEEVCRNWGEALSATGAGC
ncbi:MAG: aminotransferase class IV [Opitutus sp.]